MSETVIHPWESDVVTVEPTIVGKRGRAWLLEPAPFPAGVATWLIEAGWAHPVWHSYILSVCHLRPLAADPKPILYLPDASHELILLALQPDQPRQKMFTDRTAIYPLVPPNFCAQISERSDVRAFQRARFAAVDVVEGRLSPDTDFRHDWIARFGGHMVRS